MTIIIEETSQKLQKHQQKKKKKKTGFSYYLWKVDGPENVKAISAPYTKPD